MPDAYLEGLRLLTRREFSEAQLRSRLARKAHEPQDVDDAVARLRAEGALDDSRTAAAIARTALTLRRLGPRRARRALQAAGIPAEVAEAALRDALDGVDAVASIEAALERSLLHSDRDPLDERTAARLYRRLVSHGHDPELVARAIGARRGGTRAD